MTANPHLVPILDGWLSLDTPGFAIMVTAPWGAGKSFAINLWRQDKQYVYVSLFGVDSPKAIEEALFQGALERDGGKESGKLAQTTARAFDGAAALLGGAIGKATNVTVDLSGLYRNAVLKLLPKLLIFDDLERAQMPAPQLLSVLNRYVEHQGKSVLLIANEAELDSAPAQPKGEDTDPKPPKSDYRRWREKLVGRTITLAPETEAALTAFLQALPDGEGKTLLTAQRPLIRDVFDLSKTDNLRLLRQSLTDLCRFLDRLPETYRSQTKVLPGLMGDFLALSIAWHAGGILEPDDFSFVERMLEKQLGQGDSGPPNSGYWCLKERYDQYPFVCLDGGVLPDHLARLLIIEGYASDENIAQQMHVASNFLQPAQRQWHILWQWRRADEADVIAAFNAVKVELSVFQITEPDTLLHIFGVFLDLPNCESFYDSNDDVVRVAVDYIDQLVVRRVLRPIGERYQIERWFSEGQSESRGYLASDTKDFERIRIYLTDALERVQSTTRLERLEALLTDLEVDPTRFTQAVYGHGDISSGIPNLREEPVFLAGDAEKVAGRVFALPPSRWSKFLSPMERRIDRQEFLARDRADGRATERNWLIAFRDAAQLLSKECSPLKSAQMRHALQHLSFLDTPLTPPKPLKIP
ncbi:MAG: P-loop NTPase fold protein [Paracoccaceae bacterium]